MEVKLILLSSLNSKFEKFKKTSLFEIKLY
jgi:hypothetical protein